MRNIEKFEIGDRVELVGPILFAHPSLGGATPKTDLSYLEGEKGVVDYFIPNMLGDVEDNIRIGLGFYGVKFDNPDIGIPIGLQGMILPENLKLVK